MKRLSKLMCLLMIGALLALASVESRGEAANASVPQLASRNTSSDFAINVPGSVLADAAPDGVSGAVVASAQTFDWGYVAPAFAAVSGTFTATPAPPSTALTPAEQATFNQIVANYDGAPATRVNSLVKGAGAAGAIVGAYGLGAWVGNGIVELWGIEADGLVCRTADGIAQMAVGLLTGADCTAFNQMVEEFEANTDVAPTVQGGTSCDASGNCMTLESEQTINYTAPFGLTPSQWVSARFWCFSSSNPNATTFVSYLRPTGPSYTFGSPWPTNNWAFASLATCPGSRWTSINAASQSAPFPPFKPRPAAWVYNPVGTTAQVTACLDGSGPCLGGSRAVPTEVVADIDRTIVCSIIGSDNITYLDESDVFTEGSRTLPRIVCPQLPAGVTPESVALILEGGATPFNLLEQNATDAYLNWWQTHPECRNGSCFLDLRQNSNSCFSIGINCEDWFEAPDRNATYTCHYGTHQIPLEECFIYGTLFSEINQDEGFAYSDPLTGAPIQTPSSPTPLEKLTNRLLERRWLEHGPTPGGFVYGATDPYAAAVAVAERCIELQVRAECQNLPIFAPGDDIREAAQHDLDAIRGNPEWVILSYGPTDPPTQSGWYAGHVPCIPGSYNAVEKNCDEYPFRSTQQAGPGASLRTIKAEHNQKEGTLLGIFFQQCGLSVGDQFVVAPTPTVGPDPVTTTAAWCGS